MSKDQNQTKKLEVKNVDKLITSYKMINEIKSGLKYWKFDQIWPTNLYVKTIEQVLDLLNQVLSSNDFCNEPNKNWPFMDK